MAVAFPESAHMYTADELFAMPSDMRYVLIQGKLAEMGPLHDALHGAQTAHLSARASVFAEDNHLGMYFVTGTGFKIESDPDTVLAADWAFVAKEQLPFVMPDGYLNLAPDIVLETRSPSETAREVAQKTAMWLAAGVRMVWELDPARQVLTVHRPGAIPVTLGPEDTLTGEEILPGFEFSMARLFVQPPASGA